MKIDAAATWSGCTAYDARSSKLLKTVVRAKSKLSAGFSFICASMDMRYGIFGGNAISASRKRSSNARFSSGVGNSFTLNNTMCFTILIYICIFVLGSVKIIPPDRSVIVTRRGFRLFAGVIAVASMLFPL